MAKKIWKKLMHFAQLSSQKSTKSGIFHFFRKSGSGRCSKCSKTCENLRKFKIQKNFEKLILELPFGGGFIKIHNLARFLQHFEIWWFSRFSTPFSKMGKIVLPLISGSVRGVANHQPSNQSQKFHIVQFYKIVWGRCPAIVGRL